ncbi:poly-gamma-glutamate synthesis protein (capsule biosynthesis protein) [Psychrobacillus sp. OK028]|uniref:CapA family protein n=1 Tax=Psychrobacillus sp. OK028 TaxID=1884359 RepID=UPI00088BA603|nr:CapA family protein [Psychrobacillus sp. OK028]SDN88558.1 poly-gamma-glutamate synthesis protein (capsule biosynthesis protein) [Psychrobacillus sp. OK028]
MLFIKSLAAFLIVTISILFYFNLQIEEPITFNKEFHGKQFSTFYMGYEEEKIEIGMIGDVLLHLPLYNYTSYLPSLSPVQEELQSIDLLIANQESIPAGEVFKVSGYPNFSSPPHIISDLKEIGVDVLSIANNHTLDQGEKGLLEAIQQMEKVEMPYIGAYKSVEDLKVDRIFQVENVSLGLLGYTYGTNSHETPVGKDYLVNRINEDRIAKEIKELKTKVDFVVVSIHWGTEYNLEANDNQKQLARSMAEAGADIVFGHHPHVIQPYELILSENGHPTHVFYSLGNFLSGQKDEYTNIGGIAKIEVLKKNINGKQVVTLENPVFLSTAVVKGDPYTVNFLTNVESEMGKTDAWVQQHVFGVK